MKKSLSFVIFNKRLNKVIMHPSHFTGFYCDDITLSNDLKHWLKTNKLYNACTTNTTILFKNKIYTTTELKAFISINDIKSYINYIDEAIHLKEGA